MNAIHFGVMIVSMQKKQQQKNHQVLDLLLFFLNCFIHLYKSEV